MSLTKLNNSLVAQHHSSRHSSQPKNSKAKVTKPYAYTYRPIQNIDLTCNVHPKVIGRLTTKNIPTIAYERYTENPVLPDQEETNFSKNYYLENCPERFQLNNTILSDVEAEIATHNAYTLASGATEEYNRFAKQRQDYLHNARRRANVAFNQFYAQKRQEKDKARTEEARWITEYFRKVQELIDHIFRKQTGENEDPNLQDRLFLKEQGGNTAKRLQGVKLSNPEAALNILQSLRALLLGRKAELEQNRKDQEYNKSVSNSCLDSSNTSQNMTAASFMSGTTNASKEEGEADFAQQFCDFQALQKKWGKANVEEVRNILRVKLTRDLVNKAEGHEMREKQKAKDKNDFLRREMERMGQLKPKKKQGVKGKKEDKSSKQVNRSVMISRDNEKASVFFKDYLSKQEQTVKSTLLKGGVYDSVGSKFQRHRNYSSLFKSRRDESPCNISLREDHNQKHVYTDRTGLK